MKITGEYRDVLTSNGAVVVDMGWRSNAIVNDFGRFLAALMKRDFNINVKDRSGIDYIAFGSGSATDDEFKSRIIEFLKKYPDLSKPLRSDSPKYWVWAKQIDKSSMKYLDASQVESQNPTNVIRIEVVVGENEPPQETLDIKEFGLFGMDRQDNGSPRLDRVFFVNYINHEMIGKTPDMILNRTIVLKFL
jgi:hypothetical protein